MNKIQISVLLAVLLVISGVVVTVNANCSGFPGKSEWELEVWISQEERLENGTINLHGEVSMSGHVTDTTVNGVSVVFSDEENETSDSLHIGTLSGYIQQNVTVNLDYTPEVVRIETTDIQTSDETKYWIKGLERNDVGQYEQFVQEERTC
jgi:hypothetical protein